MAGAMGLGKVLESPIRLRQRVKWQCLSSKTLSELNNNDEVPWKSESRHQ